MNICQVVRSGLSHKFHTYPHKPTQLYSHLQAGLEHLLAVLERIPLGVQAAALKVLLEESNRKKLTRQGGMRQCVRVQWTGGAWGKRKTGEKNVNE